MDINRNKPLVSIVSPVYNAEEYVGRMLSSLLAQSYRNIELICVDDGSTDNTAAVIKSCSEAFAENQMRLVYKKVEHGGQTAAVSAGLKLLNGEYLSWVDSDDFLTEDSIETKLAALMDDKAYDIATSNFFTVDEDYPKTVLGRRGDWLGNLNYQSRQFYLAIAGMSIIESNCHLVRANCLDAAIPKRELIPCAEGQNYQLMLPLYFKYRRLYIPKPLAYYVMRRCSHYHQKRSAEQWRTRNTALMQMLEQVLEGLDFSRAETARVLKMSCFNYDGG